GTWGRVGRFGESSIGRSFAELAGLNRLVDVTRRVSGNQIKRLQLVDDVLLGFASQKNDREVRAAHLADVDFDRLIGQEQLAVAPREAEDHAGAVVFGADGFNHDPTPPFSRRRLSERLALALARQVQTGSPWTWTMRFMRIAPFGLGLDLVVSLAPCAPAGFSFRQSRHSRG